MSAAAEHVETIWLTDGGPAHELARQPLRPVGEPVRAKCRAVLWIPGDGTVKRWHGASATTPRCPDCYPQRRASDRQETRA